jgi:hypothetical protein
VGSVLDRLLFQPLVLLFVGVLKSQKLMAFVFAVAVSVNYLNLLGICWARVIHSSDSWQGDYVVSFLTDHFIG